MTKGRFLIGANVEYFDFGIQAMPALPTRSEVDDVTSEAVKKLKHVKLGC